MAYASPVPGFPAGWQWFGVQLDDGTLVTPYSYHTPQAKTRMEVVRWKLPEPK